MIRRVVPLVKNRNAESYLIARLKQNPSCLQTNGSNYGAPVYSSRVLNHYNMFSTSRNFLLSGTQNGSLPQRILGVRSISGLSSNSLVAGNVYIAWKKLAWLRWKQLNLMHNYTMAAYPFPSRFGLSARVLIRKTTRNALLQLESLHLKQISRIHSYKVAISPFISRIACVTSLAATRFNILSYLLALMAGELAFISRVHADGEYMPSSDTIYMRAQDGHIYITSLIFSVAELVMIFLRSIYLALLFTPSIVMAPFADSLGYKYRKFWLHLVHLTLENAGPAFIKWGQWAATRPDLFPSDLCAELTKLHTKAPSHSFSYTKKTIEKAFGRKLSDIFENFEEEPVASGSVAQVHRASLRVRNRGQTTKNVTVAVKVRHPGVGDSIRRDFAIINTVAKVSRFIPTLKWLRLDESVQQFAVFMMSQVDLAREAAHLSRFIYNFRRWKDVSFPKPLYPLVHPAVLVETYEHGESVSHYVDELEGHDRFKSALAHIGTHALLKMLLVDNFVHADMHPGNILVRVAQPKSKQNGLYKLRPHVIFLDVGMTAELSSNDRANLLTFFKAVALRDGRTAAECTLRMSARQNCPNPEAFIKEVEKTFTFWGTPEGDSIHPAECMHELLDQVRRHQVNVDGNVCTVMVTTLVLEGWQRKLDPDYDVMRTLQTLLFKVDWAKSLQYTIEGLMAP